jgi:hypothetical protein
MITVLTTALVGAAALLMGTLSDPVSRELDTMRAQTDLRNVMTPLFGGPSDR